VTHDRAALLVPGEFACASELGEKWPIYSTRTGVQLPPLPSDQRAVAKEAKRKVVFRWCKSWCKIYVALFVVIW
jgi:hypothetical protein